MKTTGSFMPSSRHLARAMTQIDHVRGDDAEPLRVLEVGPGTGPFTRRILPSLRPGDEFHIVEINRSFCRGLERRLLKRYRQQHPDVTIELHCSAIEDAKLTGRFDRIVCGLPFNNFPAMQVRAIFRQLLNLLSDGGELTYFEYMAVRPVRASISNRQARQNIRRIGALNKSLHRRHAGHTKIVLGNFPPAVAHCLTRYPDHDAAGADAELFPGKHGSLHCNGSPSSGSA